MVIALEFIKRLQVSMDSSTLPRFDEEFINHSTIRSFKDVLENYSKYYKNLSSSQQKEASTIFWAVIKEIGTPIIEDLSDEEVRVYFLFPKYNFDHARNKLYISGDFHGFTSTNNVRQEMLELTDTDIMYRVDNIPKNSVIIYQFLQAPPEYQNKNRSDISGPSEALPLSFYDTDPIPPAQEDPQLNKFKLVDENSKHTDFVGTLFCANVDNNLSHVNLMKNANWVRLLDTDGKHSNYFKNLCHRATYLSDRDDQLHADTTAGHNYLDNLFKNTEQTRSVSVFIPKGIAIENLIIFNDGASYLASGAVEHLDSVIEEGKIPKNTAIICVTPLPGLIEKYKIQSPVEFAESNDPRAIEFGTKIEDYIKFIDEMLKQLRYDYIPAEKRIVIGASMSGTASLYMTLEHKDKFGSAISQAPSYANRIILRPTIQKRKLAKVQGHAEDLSASIQLSCGKFDSLEYAQNLNFANTQELAVVLGNEIEPLPIHSGNYGHTTCCWAIELTKTLPKLYREQQEHAAVPEARPRLR